MKRPHEFVQLAINGKLYRLVNQSAPSLGKILDSFEEKGIARKDAQAALIESYHDRQHDIPLAKQWTDKAGQRAVAAIRQAGEHRAAMRDAVDAAIESVESASPVVQALLAVTNQTVATVAARAGSSDAIRAQSAMIRAELDAARAMAALSGKAKRKMRDQLRAAKHAAR